MDSRMLYPNCSEYTYAIPIGEVPEGFVERLEEFIEKEREGSDCNIYEDEIGDDRLLVIDGYDGDMGEGVGDFLEKEIGTRGIDIESAVSEARLEMRFKKIPKGLKSLFKLYEKIEAFVARGIWTRDVGRWFVVEFTEDNNVDQAFYKRMIEVLEEEGVEYRDKAGFDAGDSKLYYALLFGDKKEKDKAVKKALKVDSVGVLHYLALLNGVDVDAKKNLAKTIVENKTTHNETLLSLLPLVKQASVRNIIGERLLGAKESTRYGEIARAVAKHCTGKLREEAEIQAATLELQGQGEE